MATGFLTSSSLIETVKREAMIPVSQNTFQPADFLAMANQELRVSLVPELITYHEEYMVRDSDPITIVANQNNYAIPYRAVGQKFRAVYYKDINGQLRSMTRISPDDRPYYQQTNFQNRFIYFYLQGNEVMILPDVGENPTGFLVFSYYLRPNELVDESRVSTIQNISFNGTQSYSVTGNISSGSNIISNLNTTIGLAVNMSVSGSGIPPATIVQSIVGSTVTINNNATATTTADVLVFNNTTSFQMNTIPQNLTAFTQQGKNITGYSTSTLLDILQYNPGHKTISFDKSPVLVDTTNSILIFNTTDTPASITNGDYIAFAGECIIPQIPPDMHDVLCQRVVTRVLLALGDQAGYQAATQKLGDMVSNAAELITNRSEAEGMKVNNLRGVLRSSKIRKRGWI